jgi:hypothetical protein
MKNLLTLTAIVEAGAGLALLGLPSMTASLLLGAPLVSVAAASLARIGGAAITALAIICWLGRDGENSLALRGLVAAMIFYNVAVGVVLILARLGNGLHGVLLWPAVAFHAAMGVWCVAGLVMSRSGDRSGVAP